MFEKGDIINNRFEIVSKIGEGGMGVTFLGEDLADRKKIVVKCLQIHRLKDWKSIDLFKREADVLKNMHHRFIPAYIDFFEYGDKERLSFILVQEFIAGTNLLEKVNSGWHATEDEISSIAIKILQIVSYIHGLRPSVIHRDINPKNIIMNEPGDIFLVDFGSVQDAVKSEQDHYSTFVGTPGYIPIEQFQAKATVKSDLFAIAATIVFLLTHKPVTDFQGEGLKPDTNMFTSSQALRVILDNYLEPDQRNRTISIPDAIAMIEGKKELTGIKQESNDAKPVSVKSRVINIINQLKQIAGKSTIETTRSVSTDPGVPPSGSKIDFFSDEDTCEIIIPPGKGGGDLISGFFVKLWNGAIFFFTIIILSVFFLKGPLFRTIPFILFLVPFWAVGIGLGYNAFFNRFGNTKIVLNRNKNGFIEKSLFSKKEKSFETSDISGCDMEIAYRNNNMPVYQCRLITPNQSYAFGQKLTNDEKKWICDTINYWINSKKK
jgi:serine/threonine protein kinase